MLQSRLFFSLLCLSSAMYAAQPQDVRYSSPTPNITHLTSESVSQALHAARAENQQRVRDARRPAQQRYVNRPAQ